MNMVYIKCIRPEDPKQGETLRHVLQEFPSAAAHPWISVGLLLAVATPAGFPQSHTTDLGYLGSAACAGCHKVITIAQSHTNMALTWQGAVPESFPRDFDERRAEGPVHYRLHRVGSRLLWGVRLPDRLSLELPVEVVVGGPRHGQSFLVRVTEIEGENLERAPLVETRFLQNAHEMQLVLSPGFTPEQPRSYETAIGHVLSAEFEKKCLACHGLPVEGGAKERGVRCESCHGPGEAHVTAIKRGNPQPGTVNADELTADRSLALCARCHSGFSKPAAPMPDELLIASQVVALRNTDCFKQGGKSLTCTTCHDPHHDAKENEGAYITTCRKCHSLQMAKHAGVCPVNQNDDCIGCHMPKQTKGTFQMVDHWIRVHPERPAPPHEWIPAFRSHITPTTEFLRLIRVTDEVQAKDIRHQLDAGSPFFDLAVKYSSDSSATNGGYLGELKLEDLDPVLAVAASNLRYGEISPVLGTLGKFLILGRMPRDFRYRAAEIEREADALREKGNLRQAVDKYWEALRMYPAFLRALLFMGAAQQQLGEIAQAAGLLQYAARLYPNDAAAQFNLGIAYNSIGDAEKAIVAYRKAIDLEPNFVQAYLNLGLALYSANRITAAISVFREGLRIDPISAPLYYGLGIAEQRQGDTANAKHALTLAEKINPAFVRQQQRE
jgi:tetratricopeptide (TPR) repeat protein